MNAKLIFFIGGLMTVGQVALGQGTAFTYQGRLTDNGAPANGSYDLRFSIYDDLSGGNLVGNPITNVVAVSDGTFTVILDFGEGIFPGTGRWLEIAVRTNGTTGAFTTLAPLQPFTAAPYAITAGTATDSNLSRLNVPNTSSTATGVAIVTSGFITGATVTRAGLGYQSTPSVTVNDPTGSGAVITATVSAGKVVALTVQNPGNGYSAGATLTIGAPPSNAFQTFITPNFFTGINTLTNPNNVFSGTFAGGFSGDGGALTNLNASLLQGLGSASFWHLNGNGGSSAGADFLGTTDNQPLELKVNNVRALRLEPTTNGAPNVIGGSGLNLVEPGVVGATIVGGGALSYQNAAHTNRVGADFGVIGGGLDNQIRDGAVQATIAGGGGNWIQLDSEFSAILGGGQNLIQTNARYCAVGGGSGNTISNYALACTIGGGAQNSIQSAESSPANFAVVPGGYGNKASGQYSFAAGFQAAALRDGDFVWADSQGGPFESTANDQFLIRAAGGVGIGLNHPLGALSIATGNATATVRNDGNVSALVMSGGIAPGTLRLRNIMEVWPNDAGTAAGRVDVRGLNGSPTITLNGSNGNVQAGSFTQTSDRNAKENFRAVDSRQVLDKVAGLPISQWNFKGDPTVHLGPMAQDFYSAFALGPDDKHIVTVDEEGVALAALQGLNLKLEEKSARIKKLEARIERLERLLTGKESLEK